MTLKTDDRVLILENGYDAAGDPNDFKGELGVVRKVERDPDGTVIAYQIELDNKAKHHAVSGGDELFTWPFYAEELVKLDA